MGSAGCTEQWDRRSTWVASVKSVDSYRKVYIGSGAVTNAGPGISKTLVEAADIGTAEGDLEGRTVDASMLKDEPPAPLAYQAGGQQRV